MTEHTSSLAFVVRVAPLYALALALTGVGAIPLGVRVPSAWLVPLAILALLVFAALMTFRRARTWSTVLLMAFGVMAGVLLRLMLPESLVHWPWALAASTGLPLLGIPIGWTAGPRLGWTRWVTWAAACIYVAGLLAWQLMAHDLPPRLPWGIAGLAVFSALTLSWASTLPDRKAIEPAACAASELYLIGLNLGIAALMVAGGQVQHGMP